MLKKRLVGVITVKDGQAVQSFGYKRYLPLGSPEILLENLDRWGVDEILLQCIDCSRRSYGPNLALLEQISSEGRSTPLIYSGGVDSEFSAVAAIQAGADRICIDSLLHVSPQSVERISSRLGAQAVIASIPVTAGKGGVEWFDYRRQTSKPIGAELMGILNDRVVSEAFVIDWQNEGVRQGFNADLLGLFASVNTPIIAFGGLSEPDQIKSVLSMPSVSAVAVGNFLAYKEHAVQTYKACLAGLPIREAYYNRENYS
ncbi:HisA/HisF-related TIM barrel protein [Marinobacterium sp. LSUCC0821]|uniref:HisA/HisF-related TIM barrel protein n=1 Tax=Marinobacterium sp. LSUCC0821 TaxID=2668067 RepID=UPI001452069A|nr:HisA/HisF-related TIM barrel protein [Marinobacterium sp. LSUCC0821]QJD72166.1 hypothetical protein HH196_10885 [Marinobacterium sp. LSUCC0821]